MLDNQTMAARIRSAIEDSHHTQESIAEAFGVTVQAVSGWVRTGKVDKRRLPRLAALTGKDLAYFMPEANRDAAEEEWPHVKAVTQGVALGAGMTPDEYAETHKLKFRAASLQRKGLRPQNLEVYYGRGDSMEPRIQDGDAILVDKSDTRIVDDRIYFIRHDGHYFVKRLQKHGDLTMIVSDNRDDPQWRRPRIVQVGDDFEVLGRVRWIGSWED